MRTVSRSVKSQDSGGRICRNIMLVESLTDQFRRLAMCPSPNCLDAYDPRWSFGQRGISDAWMRGWCYAFALYAQALACCRHPEPVTGLGLVSDGDTTASEQTVSRRPQTIVRFRQVRITVADPDAFFQGIWEGQLAALDAQPAWQVLRAAGASGPLSSARYVDELLDLMYETGTHGIDFLTGYVLGYSEGLLCGRLVPPARVQTERCSTSVGSGENS